jgi:hypothetical protein
MTINNLRNSLYETHEINGIYEINETNVRTLNSPNNINNTNNIINLRYGRCETNGRKGHAAHPPACLFDANRTKRIRPGCLVQSRKALHMGKTCPRIMHLSCLSFVMGEAQNV